MLEEYFFFTYTVSGKARLLSSAYEEYKCKRWSGGLHPSKTAGETISKIRMSALLLVGNSLSRTDTSVLSTASCSRGLRVNRDSTTETIKLNRRFWNHVDSAAIAPVVAPILSSADVAAATRNRPPFGHVYIVPRPPGVQHGELIIYGSLFYY